MQNVLSKTALLGLFALLLTAACESTEGNRDNLVGGSSGGNGQSDQGGSSGGNGGSRDGTGGRGGTGGTGGQGDIPACVSGSIYPDIYLTGGSLSECGICPSNHGKPCAVVGQGCSWSSKDNTAQAFCLCAAAGGDGGGPLFTCFL